jgi:hypothetical protein
MFAVSPIQTSIYNPETPIPDNIFWGHNAPDGAIINYYLDQPANPAPSIDVMDASGRVIRHLKGKQLPNQAGINRLSWNLTEDGPVTWNASIHKNIEPKDGAEVLPGTYTVMLHAGGRTVQASVVVKQDPRDPSTLAQYQARHNVLAQLTSELSGVNEMLNGIDAKKPIPVSLAAIKSQLTSAPAFDDDDITRPPGLRERLLDLLFQFSSSFQAPTAPLLQEASALKQQYDNLSAKYRLLAEFSRAHG